METNLVLGQILSPLAQTWPKCFRLDTKYFCQYKKGFLDNWKIAKVTSIYKAGDSSNISS